MKNQQVQWGWRAYDCVEIFSKVRHDKKITRRPAVRRAIFFRTRVAMSFNANKDQGCKITFAVFPLLHPFIMYSSDMTSEDHNEIVFNMGVRVIDFDSDDDQPANKKHKLDNSTTPPDFRQQLDTLRASTEAVIVNGQKLLEQADEKFRTVQNKLIDLHYELTQSRDKVRISREELAQSEALQAKTTQELETKIINLKSDLVQSRGENERITNDFAVSLHRVETRLGALQIEVQSKEELSTRVTNLQRELAEKTKDLENLVHSSKDVEVIYDYQVDQVLALRLLNRDDATTNAKTSDMQQWAKKLTDKLRNPNETSAEERLECVVCCDRERAVLFKPCSHMVTCKQCSRGSTSAPMRHCPICRTAITARFRVTL